jgi:hypothetical protein
MDSALMIGSPWCVWWFRNSPYPCGKSGPGELPRELPEQNLSGIMDFQGFLEAESRKEQWTPQDVT